jgi:hypothetical protein
VVPAHLHSHPQSDTRHGHSDAYSYCYGHTDAHAHPYDDLHTHAGAHSHEYTDGDAD